MRIAIANFRGEIPRANPRLLPDGFAQEAVNTRLHSGALQAYRGRTLIHAFGTPTLTAFKDTLGWLGWAGDVEVVRGPVAQDRIYYTGDGAPKVREAGVVYGLALAAPTVKPTTVRSGTLNTALQETVLYAYTNVTSLDEESAPSPLSTGLLWSPGCTVTVSGFSAAPAGRAVDRRRIYRSQTSALGITDLYFVKELPVGTTSYVHDITVDPLAEVIPSRDYDTPPATMKGLTEMPNGMMAAFNGREILFCEPYRPHAWPIKYRLKVNHQIVGLACFGSTLAVLTEGTPYIVQGSSPDTMVMERMESGLPCVSARGIVDLGYAAAYPSNEGLVVLTASSSEVVTRHLFTEREWKALGPETMFAARMHGQYVFAHIVGSNVTNFDFGNELSTYVGLDNYLTGGQNFVASVTYDGGRRATSDGAQRAIGIIDLTNEMPFFVQVRGSTIGNPTSLYSDPKDGKLYVIIGGELYLFDSDQEIEAVYTWKSRRFVLTTLENFGAIWVEADEGPTEEAYLTTRIYADGELKQTLTDFNKPKRLNSGFLSNVWEIELEGTARVTAVSMAGSIEELMV